MKKIMKLAWGMIALFAIDRLTKLWALKLDNEWVVNKNLSCALIFNRGINWGMFNCTSTWVFVFLTIAIGIIISGLMIMLVGAYKLGKPILGYALILTGAFSNFLDRIFYGGVIDFIVVWFGDWSWPAFNIADAAILLGICFLIKDNFFE
ncbi:MAG: lipoprotein signal peptidase [Candidatus Babeliales bacterium]